jgi:putative addiction module component (TIGR02574 family)
MIAGRSLSDLLAFPVAQRAEVPTELWGSLYSWEQAQALPLEPLLAQELDRRWEAHWRNLERAVLWEQVGEAMRLG